MARVEKAFLVRGDRTLTLAYYRTGTGWSAQRSRNGRVTWKPLPAAQGRQPVSSSTSRAAATAGSSLEVLAAAGAA